MFYIERGDDHKITALHKFAKPGIQEQKSALDDEVLEFLNSHESWKQLMALTDLGTIRIVEDLIDILVRKKLIQFTDLPIHAQQRIQERKHLREQIHTECLLVSDVL
ncbi:MAG: tryptophan synthase subunit beta like protein [Geobacteraceae bacterium]|nr:tryptophan synthase subunit beta like protein [Geobacteraceae bacterium]